MAVLAVVAAGNGGLGNGEARPPEHVPMVIPADGTPTGGAFRRTRPPPGAARTVPPVSPSTITVTTTRTLPVPQVSGHAGEPDPDGRRDPGERSDEPGGGGPGEPQTCAGPDGGGKAAAPVPGEDCPAGTAAPEPSFTRIPQTGDGESPSPSPSASATATASPSPSSSGPVPQLGD
jgi:hypothetical protein